MSLTQKTKIDTTMQFPEGLENTPSPLGDGADLNRK